MPRRSREPSPTGIYHVMLRGINKSTIFHDEVDYMKMTHLLSVISSPTQKNGETQQPGCDIYAYCLMPNHLHLLLGEQGETLERTMKRIGVSYVRYYNQRRNRAGHLFQDRFRSEAVGDSKYFATLLRYIHFNPVAAGMVRLPGHYRWSSWHEFETPLPPGTGICRQSVPFGNIEWDELRQLVLQNPDIEKFVTAIDVERAEKTEHAKALISNLLPEGHNLTDVRDLPKRQRNSIILAALDAGVSQQNLARIIGVSRPTIQRIWHASQQK